MLDSQGCLHAPPSSPSPLPILPPPVSKRVSASTSHLRSEQSREVEGGWGLPGGGGGGGMVGRGWEGGRLVGLAAEPGLGEPQ